MNKLYTPYVNAYVLLKLHVKRKLLKGILQHWVYQHILANLVYSYSGAPLNGHPSRTDGPTITDAYHGSK